MNMRARISLKTLALSGVLILITLVADIIVFRHNQLWDLRLEDIVDELYRHPIMLAAVIFFAVCIAYLVAERQRAILAIQQSEARYRSLFHDNHAVMLLIDPLTTAIVDGNDAACAYYGYTIAELTARTLTDINLEPVPDTVQRIQRVLNGESNQFHGQHILANGTTRELEINAGLITIAGRQLLYEIIYDITDRKAAEAGLRLDEARLEALLALSHMTQATPQELADFTIEEAMNLTRSAVGFFGVLSEDRTTTTMLSWTRAIMDGCQVEDTPMVFSIADAGLWAEPIRQRQPIIVNDYRATPLTRKGFPPGHIPIRRYMSVPVLEDGEVVAIAAVGNKEENYNAADQRQLQLMADNVWKLLQERRAREQTLALRLEKERLKILSDFIRDASHEFRTPLSVINTSAYLMSRTDDRQKQTQLLKTLELQVSYMEELVERMLTTLRIDNAADLIPEMSDSSAILKEVAGRLESQIAQKELALTMNLAADIPPVREYGGYLHLALLEIITNAVQYTPAGGSIQVGSAFKDNAVVVTVVDTGEGIDPEDLPHIFTNFYRADEARTERHAGLGLSIAKKILDIHSGQIEVDSAKGKGTTVRVTLPVAETLSAPATPTTR